VYQSVILAVWDAIRDVAPFGFRVLTDIATYVQDASALGVEWQAAVDEQLLQKVLPKVKGTDPRIGGALEQLAALMADGFPLSNKKARRPAGRRSAAPTLLPSVCGAPRGRPVAPPGARHERGDQGANTVA